MLWIFVFFLVLKLSDVLLIRCHLPMFFFCDLTRTGTHVDEESWKLHGQRCNSAQECLFTPAPVFVLDESLTTRRERHAGEQLYCCSQCGNCFANQTSLTKHMNIHLGKFKCTECGKCCQNNRALVDHRRFHSGQKPFGCTVCNKRFTTSSGLNRHSRTHSGLKPYKCYICGKSFSVFQSLDTHISFHIGDMPYKCPLCSKSFSRSYKLKRHMRQVHSNERPYPCPVCGKTFKTNDKVKQHVRTHTRAKPHSWRHCGQTVLYCLINWSEICWGHTVKAVVIRNLSTVVILIIIIMSSFI